MRISVTHHQKCAKIASLYMPMPPPAPLESGLRCTSHLPYMVHSCLWRAYGKRCRACTANSTPTTEHRRMQTIVPTHLLTIRYSCKHYGEPTITILPGSGYPTEWHGCQLPLYPLGKDISAMITAIQHTYVNNKSHQLTKCKESAST